MTVVWNLYRSGLNGEFADAVDAALGPMADVWHVTQGLRTMAEQAALYAQGRTEPGAIVTHAQPGSSAHNYGLAVDVALSDGEALRWDYTDPAWQRLIAVVRSSQLLHSGADFPVGEQDIDHIERVNWRLHE